MAMIFGALTLLTVLPFGSIIAVLLTVTTGQGAGTTVAGLGVAAAVACACAALVAHQTRVQHRLKCGTCCDRELAAGRGIAGTGRQPEGGGGRLCYVKE
ncbi:MAG: hypothetical protein U0232_30390 [Thermomicrobiales bacterium]